MKPKSKYFYSDGSGSYDEDEYDQLNDDTFGSAALNMNPKGFSFNIAETNYRVEIRGEDIEAVNKSMEKEQQNQKPEVTKLMNLSITNSKDKELSPLKDDKEDEVTTYKNSIVDQFFLWINPHQLYMFGDFHNTNCRKMKLFNYTHIIPTLEDKMLNRIKIKFHASKYFFGVDIASLVQIFQRKLAECANLIPFNCDYYYWERIYRLNPNTMNLNRMLIVDDMWLPPVTSALELDSPRPQKPQTKPVRPPTITFEETMGSVSLSSVQFPRKVLSCDTDNNPEINRIYNPELFSDIQKRYYVLSLIDRAICLVIDYEIKTRVVTYQIRNGQKVEYKPEEMMQFQLALGEFMVKICPLYAFILNYFQGVELFIRVFYFLSDTHKIRVSKGIFEALKSDKINPDNYPAILDNEFLVNIIMFGLGDINEINNHIESYDFFIKLPAIKFSSTVFCWKFLEMIHAWLIPFGCAFGNAPPPEYILKFLYILPMSIQITRAQKFSPLKLNSILTTQQNIFKAIKETNFRKINSPITKQIIELKDSVLNNYFRPKMF